MSTLPSSEVDLISQRSQRLSVALTHAQPRVTSSRAGTLIGLLIMNTVGVACAGKAWSRLATPRVTCRYTAWSLPALRVIIRRTSRPHCAEVMGLTSLIASRLDCSRFRCCSIRNG
jgi:hypothetical protein